MPNDGDYEEVEKAKIFYAPIKDVVLDFIKPKGLDYEEWYHDAAVVMFGKNLFDLNFVGMRREVCIYFSASEKKLSIEITAFQDKPLEGRKLKSFIIASHNLPMSNSTICLFQSSLEIAWRAVCSIKGEELLDADTWQKETKNLLNAAKISS